jgi:hypothetical protein
MLKSSFVIGLIAGIFGIITAICGGCAGICGSAVDEAMKSTDATTGMDAGLNIGFVLILLSIAGIVGASIVQKKKLAGAILQACYPVIGFIFIIIAGSAHTGHTEFSGGIGLLSFILPAILFAVSSLLGFIGKVEQPK